MQIHETITTAEPPEPLDSFAVGFSFCKTSLPELVGPAARLSVYSVYSVDSKILIYRAFRAFRGSN